MMLNENKLCPTINKCLIVGARETNLDICKGRVRTWYNRGGSKSFGRT